jgi:hypothetical protein
MLLTKNKPVARTLLPAIFAVFVFLVPATPYAQSAFDGAYVLPGVYASYNIREGYRNFDGVDGYRHVENTNPFIFGLTVGKRISIDNPRLRFQAALEFGWGSVKDGEYRMDLMDGGFLLEDVEVSLHSIYRTGGLLADAHLLFPIDERTFFLSAGLGAHLTYFDTAIKLIGTGEEVSGGSIGARGALSPSVNAGCGIEYKLRGRGAACISYSLRLWQSASYKEAGALFPMGVNYTEFFYSMAVQLQYLLPKRPRD